MSSLVLFFMLLTVRLSTSPGSTQSKVKYELISQPSTSQYYGHIKLPILSEKQYYYFVNVVHSSRYSHNFSGQFSWWGINEKKLNKV